MSRRGVIPHGLFLMQTHTLIKRLSTPIVIFVIFVAGLDVWAQPGGPDDFDHSAFDRILQRHVRSERVDYLAIREHDHGHLTAYLDRIAAFSPRRVRPPAKVSAVHQSIQRNDDPRGDRTLSPGLLTL